MGTRNLRTISVRFFCFWLNIMTTVPPAPTCCSRFQHFVGVLLYVAGIGLSTYAYYVEYQLEHQTDYKPMCDIDETISCSKPFNSTFGRGFGIVGNLMGDEGHPLNVPNSVYGIGFYSFLGMLFILGGRSRFLAEFQFYLLILANCVSVYLGYLLYAVLKTLCVVCFATYIVNFLLLLIVYCRRNSLRPKPRPEYSNVDWSQPGLPTSSRVGGGNAFKKNIWTFFKVKLKCHKYIW